MSPFLERIKSLFSGGETEATSERPQDDEPRRRRRRGRRGGRGRRSASGASQGQAPTQAGSQDGSRGANQRESSQRQSSQLQSSQRQSSQPARGQRVRNETQSRSNTSDTSTTNRTTRTRRSVTDRRRPRNDRRRYQLDEPLPEDVAFRPAAEGGDSTLLPGRRRRPPGLRATSRILLGGSRHAAGFIGRDTTAPAAPPASEPQSQRPAEASPPAQPQPPAEPASDLRSDDGAATRVDARGDEADGETAGETSSNGRRRRRGRRGGRGRGRGRGADTEGSPASASAEDGGTASDDAESDGAEPKPEAPSADSQVADSKVTAPATTTVERTELDTSAMEPFQRLGVSDITLQALARFGFSEPMPIQEQAIPPLLDGADVVGVAQTGSGKTLAYGVPMAEALDNSLDVVQALVLVPTRELAQQVLEVLTQLVAPFGLKTVGLLGGHRLEGDFRALERHPHIVVGTPGRIIDHLRRQTLSLRDVRYAVLDEADEMLDIGFLPDITRILGRTPRRRQTSLFSATMPMSIKRLVHRYMRDPLTLTVDPELSTVDSVRQIYFEVAARDKLRGLSELVARELKGRTLVFSRTRRGVDDLSRRLQASGITAGALHGDMDQRRRDRVVQRFRAGELDILVATNVAARGLDIPEITHVVNYDVPQNVEEYVHRIGRTGRAGRAGMAITLVSERDVGEFDTLMKTFGDRLERERLDLYGRADR